MPRFVRVGNDLPGDWGDGMEVGTLDVERCVEY